MNNAQNFSVQKNFKTDNTLTNLNFKATCPIEDTFEKSKSNKTKQENKLVDFIEKTKELFFRTFHTKKGNKTEQVLDDFSVENKKLSNEEKHIINIYYDVAKELKIPK